MCLERECISTRCGHNRRNVSLYPEGCLCFLYPLRCVSVSVGVFKYHYSMLIGHMIRKKIRCKVNEFISKVHGLVNNSSSIKNKQTGNSLILDFFLHSFIFPRSPSTTLLPYQQPLSECWTVPLSPEPEPSDL
jgi:hypothetical protein